MTGSYGIETEGGTIYVPHSVLSRIVIRAAETVEGARVLRPRRGVEIDIEDGRAKVSVELIVQLGLVLPDVARDVQGQIGECLHAMCGIEVEAVDVSVEEVQ